MALSPRFQRWVYSGRDWPIVWDFPTWSTQQTKIHRLHTFQYISIYLNIWGCRLLYHSVEGVRLKAVAVATPVTYFPKTNRRTVCVGVHIPMTKIIVLIFVSETQNLTSELCQALKESKEKEAYDNSRRETTTNLRKVQNYQVVHRLKSRYDRLKSN